MSGTVGWPGLGPFLLGVSVAASAASLLLWPAWLMWPFAVSRSLAIAVLGLASCGVYAWSRSQRVLLPTPAPSLGARAQLAALRHVPSRSTARGAGGLASAGVALCPRPPDARSVSLLAHFRRPSPRAGDEPPGSDSICVQNADLEAAVEQLRQQLQRAQFRFPVKVDLVVGLRRWSASSPLDPLLLRPGLDGVCSGRACLLPWQLLSRSLFSMYQPWSLVPDLQLGVSPEALRKALGAPPRGDLKGLTRFETRSLLLPGDGSSIELLRMRARAMPLEHKQLLRIERRAQRHLLKAQLPDGRFRYVLEPFTGERDARGFNLARHAGAVLVLCELGGSGRAVRRAVRRALAVLPRYRRPLGSSGAGLSAQKEGGPNRLAENALPLAALLACRSYVGAEFDPLIAELAEFVLGLQRADGGFADSVQARDSGRAAFEPLYSSGQAVLALVLLERLMLSGGLAGRPSLPRVEAAVARAMRFYGTEYFRHPLREFFFIEENWHCLAARAALSTRRSARYEQLCLDYVSFKSRFILRQEAGASPSFDGGFGFGNWVPPHTSGTAGFAEAMAAALSLVPAQSAFARSHEPTLRRALQFIGRQQWSPATCFACANDEPIGGFSEHMHSSRIRIDFVQHAWAAVGHGRRWLQRFEREQARSGSASATLRQQ